MEDTSRNADNGQGASQGHGNRSEGRGHAGGGYRGNGNRSGKGGYRGRDDHRGGKRGGTHDDRRGAGPQGRDDRSRDNRSRDDRNRSGKGGYRGRDDRHDSGSGERREGGRREGYRGPRKDDRRADRGEFRGDRRHDDRGPRRDDRHEGNREGRRNDRRDNRGPRSERTDRRGGFERNRRDDRSNDRRNDRHDNRHTARDVARNPEDRNKPYGWNLRKKNPYAQRPVPLGADGQAPQAIRPARPAGEGTVDAAARPAVPAAESVTESPVTNLDTAVAAETEDDRLTKDASEHTEPEEGRFERGSHDRGERGGHGRYDRDDRRGHHRDEEDDRPFFPEFFASCEVGLEDALGRELKSFGIKKTRPLGGGVTFYTEKERAYRALMWSRLASRILVVLDHVGCRDADELYHGIRQLPWHRIISEGAKIAVFASGTNDELRNSRFTSQRVKDAICDKIRQVTGERPDVDSKHPDAVISVRVNRTRATVSFDLTGESLYHRSYIRNAGNQHVAMQVALANCMLGTVNWRTLGWRRHYRLIDPVCSNPMLIVEAACEVADRAPGLTRSKWGFTGWGEHEPALWDQLLDEADQRFEDGLAAVQGLGALALGITRTGYAASDAATCLKAAGVEGLGQVVAVDEDTVAGAVDHAMRAANRAAQGAIKRAQAEGDTDKPVRQACVVAADLLPAHDADATEHALAKNVELFLRAAGEAPAGAVNVEVGGDIEAIYGVAAVERAQVGGRKVDAPLLVFSKPPVARTPIKVVGLEDGIEHEVPVYEEGTAQFADRLRKMAKERRKWAQTMGITCYRIYDADLLDYMVTVDRYEDVDGHAYLYIAEYAAPKTVDQDRARRRFEDVVAIAPVVLGVDPADIYTKTRRQAKGGEQYREQVRDSRIIQVKEGGYTFRVDLAGRLDTGLFLDHRITRHMIQDKAAGKRFLNLFAYTGTGTVYAAGGGARSTVTVDLSGHYLKWAERNMEANGFEGRAHRFEHADVMRWIRDARAKHRRFDLIFVDPPTFSNSKQMGAATWDVQRDHAELLIGIAHLLDTSGEAIFSCNLKGFKPDTWKLTKFGIALEDISEATIPQDFERRTNIHKCYLVRHMTPEEREEKLRAMQSEKDRERAAANQDVNSETEDEQIGSATIEGVAEGQAPSIESVPAEAEQTHATPDAETVEPPVGAEEVVAGFEETVADPANGKNDSADTVAAAAQSDEGVDQEQA